MLSMGNPASTIKSITLLICQNPQENGAQWHVNTESIAQHKNQFRNILKISYSRAKNQEKEATTVRIRLHAQPRVQVVIARHSRRNEKMRKA